jgi:hypothetical protein
MMDLNLDKKQHVLKTELSSRGVKFESLFEINFLFKLKLMIFWKPLLKGLHSHHLLERLFFLVATEDFLHFKRINFINFLLIQ